MDQALRLYVESRHAPPDEMAEAYLAYRARPSAGESALIITCPHAGRYIPEEEKFARRLRNKGTLLQLQRRGDTYTDLLAQRATDHGATNIVSTVAPSFLNVGRNVDSIDPNAVRGGIQRLTVNPNDIYVGEGQGIVADRTYHAGNKIYKFRREPDEREIIDRIERFHTPFHDRVEQEVRSKLDKFGYSLIFDVHSCPSIGTHAETNPGAARPDVILSNAGDLESCSPEVMEIAQTLAHECGYSIGVNDPFKGGFITQKFGAHNRARHGLNTETLQIEFARRAYGLNEDTLEIDDPEKFHHAQRFMCLLTRALARYAGERSAECALA